MNKKFFIIVGLILALSLTVGAALAEDGLLFRKNVSKTPDAETEKAAIFMMDFYVPAQNTAGELVTLNYLVDDGTTEGTVATEYADRTYAKPLVAAYIDDIGEASEDGTGFFEEDSISAVEGGITFGKFDAFAAVSLDDGTTWKTTNLSRSQDLSSFNLKDGTAYPGDVHNVQIQVFDDNIMVVWASKFCEGGSPLYSLSPDADVTAEASDLDPVAYFADLQGTYGKDAVYLYDFFGVGGTQKSVDYEEQGWPEIGEKPFSCIWTARGKLLAGDDPSTADVLETLHVTWTKPERLTSGTRDANLPAVDCAGGVGCMITWQEDPEGLRPGLGLGPGEGWSGAVAWQQTDIWYTHISKADFDIVFADDTMDTTTEMTLADYEAAALANTELGMPKPYVPMAIPARLTDNAMCKSSKDDPYCFIDFDTLTDVTYDNVTTLLALDAPEADADFCTTQISWTNPGGTTLELCVTEKNVILDGRVASTRVRMNLKPYTKTDGTKSAWIVMAAEESKALGESSQVDPDADPIDIGKNVFYYSFDPFKSGEDEALIDQGGMLNQPAQCNEDAGIDDPLCLGVEEGDFYPVQLDDRGFEFYLTEIARRFALTTNSVKAAADSTSGLSAMLIYKQGIINQGGPADILLRRVLVDDTFDPTVDNPYAFENMECGEWLYTDGSNPNYLQGLCLDPAINISSATIKTCDTATGNDLCADTFPLNDDGSNNTSGDFPKVTEWRQCDGAASIEGCEDDNDLDDQVWENPFDVAKGHRGFLDGDYVMMMYAWSPNWNSNAVGNDHYNLYVRRSFDGGATWTTTPAALGGAGVSALEYYYTGASIGEAEPVTWTYGAGEFEQGRDVSLLVGNKITILDPRYSPTGGMKLYPTIKTDWLTANGFSAEGLPYDDDAVRDPSKFFMIYETGDNTTVAVGEAIPLNLYYSRATVWGDTWEWYDYLSDTDDCNPVDGVIDWSTCLEPRWPWVENDHEILSGEAAMYANQGGTFMYAVWNQWEETITLDGHEHIFNADMPFRRFMYLPDDTTATYAPVASFVYTGPEIYSWLDEDVATFAVSARDIDKVGEGEGIVEYSWILKNTDGTVISVPECYNGKTCTVPMRTLFGNWGDWGDKNPGAWSAGVHIKDNDGQTKDIFSPEFVVYYDIFTLNMPLMFR